MAVNKNPDNLITQSETAEILDVSIHTLKHWRQIGRTEPKYRRVRIGRTQVLYERDSVEQHKKEMRGDL